MGPLIQIIEDDLKIAELIRLYLEKEGYRVLISTDGKDGLKQAQRAQPVLIILDRMLPGLEGLEVLKELRQHSMIPVIFLSAKSDEIEKIIGLELGADDYLSKPFSPKELLARVKSVLRRSKKSQTEFDSKNTVLRFEHFQLDPTRQSVEVDGHLCDVSASEFRLLQIMAANPGRVFSRDQLLTELYGAEEVPVFDRTIDAHVKNLRKKLEDSPKNPRFIASVFGVGYKFIDHET